MGAKCRQAWDGRGRLLVVPLSIADENWKHPRSGSWLQFVDRLCVFLKQRFPCSGLVCVKLIINNLSPLAKSRLLTYCWLTKARQWNPSWRATWPGGVISLSSWQGHLPRPERALQNSTEYTVSIVYEKLVRASVARLHGSLHMLPMHGVHFFNSVENMLQF